jgi:hypothetical protein
MNPTKIISSDLDRAFKTATELAKIVNLEMSVMMIKAQDQLYFYIQRPATIKYFHRCMQPLFGYLQCYITTSHNNITKLAVKENKNKKV